MKEHWQQHSRHYDEIITQNPRYLAMLDFHVESLKDCDYVLDSGAGTGNITFKLLEKGKRVCAVDRNSEMLEKLEAKCEGYFEQLQVRQMDLTHQLDFQDETFDGVVSSYVVPYINDDIYFREINRILKSNGVFSLSAIMPEKDIFNFMMTYLEKRLTDNGMLPSCQKQWERFKGTSKKNEEIILKNGIPKNELIVKLEDLGFGVEDCENDYGKYVVFLRCKKD